MEELVALLAVVVPTTATVVLAVRSSFARRAKEMYELANVDGVGKDEADRLRARARELTIAHTLADASSFITVARLLIAPVAVMGGVASFVSAWGAFLDMQRYEEMSTSIAQEFARSVSDPGGSVSQAQENAGDALAAFDVNARIEESWASATHRLLLGVAAVLLGGIAWALLPYTAQSEARSWLRRKAVPTPPVD